MEALEMMIAKTLFSQKAIASTKLPTVIKDLLTEALAEFSFPLCLDCWGNQKIWLGASQTESTSSLRLKILHPGIIRALILTQDPLVLVEAYLHDLLDFSGKIEVLISLGQYLGTVSIKTQSSIKAWLQSLTLPRLPIQLPLLAPWQKLFIHSRRRDRAAVQYHYDLGNAFYQLWLDPLMVYSCAYFESPQMSLPEAQKSKLDLICRKLQLKPGESLLDIGCGWGALLRWAVTHYGVKGYGITLSQEQVAFNQDGIADAGWQDKLKVELLDYRDLPKQPTFDKIVSVGMVEHVGRQNYPTYFQTILAALKPGGLFLNHGITAADEWNGSSLGERFVNRYIFPDGELIQLSTTLVEMEKAGWEIVDVDSWRLHYAKTLRCWAANLEKSLEEARALIGSKRVRLWQLYLLGSALAFEENQMGIYQVLLRQKADKNWNLLSTRKDWLT
jgi:cyclopropane-fatty-acyl-phospholipid synthase